MENNKVLEKLLRENIAVAKDTNRLVHKMRRDALFGRFMRVVMWVLILGTPFFFYKYYMKEYVAEFLQAINAVNSTSDQLNVQGLLQKLIPGQVVEE